MSASRSARLSRASRTGGPALDDDCAAAFLDAFLAAGGMCPAAGDYQVWVADEFATLGSSLHTVHAYLKP